MSGDVSGSRVRRGLEEGKSIARLARDDVSDDKSPKIAESLKGLKSEC